MAVNANLYMEDDKRRLNRETRVKELGKVPHLLCSKRKDFGSLHLEPTSREYNVGRTNLQ